MMREEEDEETLFDQQVLLGTGKKSSWDWEWIRRFTKTLALSLAFFAMGLCVSMPGATLPDLEDRTHTSTERISLVFSARSVGYLLGSVVGGLLFDYFDQQILLFYTLVFTGIATIAVPWCTALASLAGMIAVQGLALGVLDTGGNMFCIKIWSKSSPPYMQMLHFGFAIGAFLAPLLARPFLGDGALATNNTSYSIHFPVNTHVPHLTGDSSSGDSRGRFTREAEWWWLTDHKQYRFVRDAENNTDEGLGLGNDTSLSGYDDMAAGNMNLTDSDIVNATDTPLTTTVPTTPRPPKPGVADAAHLGKNTASGDHIAQQILEHKSDTRTLDTKPDGGINSVSELSTVSPDAQNKAMCKVNETVSVPSQNTTDNSTVEETVERLVPCPEPTSDGAVNNSMESQAPVATNVSETAASPATGTVTIIPTVPATEAASSTTEVATTTTTTTTTATTTTTTTTTTPRPTTTTQKTTTAAKPDQPPKQDINNEHESSENKDSTSNLEQESSDNNTTTTTASTTTSTTRRPKPQTLDAFVSDYLDMVRNMSRIQFAYMIVGLFLLGNAIFFLMLYCRDCRAGTLLHQVLALGPSMAPTAPCFRISLLALLFSFFLLYVGMEVTYGGLVTTFAVDSDLEWSRAQGATLAALFWGSIATGRGMSIFIARRFKPPCMLITDLVIVIIGAVMLSFGIQASPMILWVGTVVLGLGMSSVFPTAVSWADCYYPLTGRAAAVFIAGSGVGEMVIPVLTGYLFEKVHNMWLMYMVLGLAVLLTLVYICLQCIASRNPMPTSVSKLGFMPLQSEDDNGENNIPMNSIDSEDVINGSAGRYRDTVTHRRKPATSNHITKDKEETTMLVDFSDD